MEKMVFDRNSRLYSSLRKNISTKNTSVEKEGKKSFKEIKEEITTKDMSMQDYKEYIYEKIANIDMHSTQVGITYDIRFSSAALERMKKESGFEKFVLNTVKEKFSQKVSKEKQGKMILYFTDKENEYREEFVKLEKMKDKEEEGKSFWQIRRERQHKIDEEVFEKKRKKKIREKRIRNIELERKNAREYAYAMRTKKKIEENTGKKVNIEYLEESKIPLSVMELLETL